MREVPAWVARHRASARESYHQRQQAQEQQERPLLQRDEQPQPQEQEREWEPETVADDEPKAEDVQKLQDVVVHEMFAMLIVHERASMESRRDLAKQPKALRASADHHRTTGQLRLAHRVRGGEEGGEYSRIDRSDSAALVHESGEDDGLGGREESPLLSNGPAADSAAALENDEGGHPAEEVEDETIQDLVKDMAVQTINKVGAGVATGMDSLQGAPLQGAAENAKDTAKKIGAVITATVGVTGTDNLVEQWFIFTGWAQSFSLYTMPDFIDWPDEWLSYFDWIHSFTFGLDFGLMVPGSSPQLKFAVKMLPPVLVVLRVRLLKDGIFSKHDEIREAWLRRNVEERITTRNRLMFDAFGTPLAILCACATTLWAMDDLWADDSDPATSLWTAARGGLIGLIGVAALRSMPMLVVLGCATLGWAWLPFLSMDVWSIIWSTICVVGIAGACFCGFLLALKAFVEEVCGSEGESRSLWAQATCCLCFGLVLMIAWSGWIVERNVDEAQHSRNALSDSGSGSEAQQVGLSTWHVVTARDDPSSSSGSGSAAIDPDELVILSAGASVTVGLVSAWCTCGGMIVMHRYWLHRKYRYLEVLEGKDDAEAKFFQQWAGMEGAALLFLYSATYLGPVTECLKQIAVHEGDSFVPWVIWGSVVVAAASTCIASNARNGCSTVLSDTRMLGCSLCGISAALIYCFVTASSGLFVTAWLLLPVYALGPIALLVQMAHGTMHKHELLNLTDDEEFAAQVAAANEKQMESPGGAFKSAGIVLVSRYEAKYWWTKPYTLFEKAIVATIITSSEGTIRLYLSLIMAASSCAMMIATRPYLGDEEDRTESFGRLSNLILVCTGAAMELKRLSKVQGQYVLAGNSACTSLMFIMSLGPLRMLTAVARQLQYRFFAARWLERSEKRIMALTSAAVQRISAAELRAAAQPQRKHLVCYQLTGVVAACATDSSVREFWAASKPCLTADELDLSGMDVESEATKALATTLPASSIVRVNLLGNPGLRMSKDGNDCEGFDMIVNMLAETERVHTLCGFKDGIQTIDFSGKSEIDQRLMVADLRADRATHSLVTLNLLGVPMEDDIRTDLIRIFEQTEHIQTLCGFEEGVPRIDFSGKSEIDQRLLLADIKAGRATSSVRGLNLLGVPMEAHVITETIEMFERTERIRKLCGFEEGIETIDWSGSDKTSVDLRLLVADLRADRATAGLQRLNLDWSGTTAADAQMLVEHIKGGFGAGTLRCLDLSTIDGMTPAMAKDLAAGCKGLRVLEELNVSGSDGLNAWVLTEDAVRFQRSGGRVPVQTGKFCVHAGMRAQITEVYKNQPTRLNYLDTGALTEKPSTLTTVVATSSDFTIVQQSELPVVVRSLSDMKPSPSTTLTLLREALPRTCRIILSAAGDNTQPDSLPPCDGMLKVELIRCSAILAADFNGMSDPFVVMRLGDAEVKSKTITKTLYPVFDEVLELPVVADASFGGHCLIIELWDRNRATTDDYLGEAVVHLRRFFPGRWSGASVPGRFAFWNSQNRLAKSERNKMEAKIASGNDMPCGSVELKLTFVPSTQ
eukprot:COSAG02_NODE_4464_length_5334_cov_9.211652_2_plen_1555_part_00